MSAAIAGFEQVQEILKIHQLDTEIKSNKRKKQENLDTEKAKRAPAKKSIKDQSKELESIEESGQEKPAKVSRASGKKTKKTEDVKETDTSTIISPEKSIATISTEQNKELSSTTPMKETNMDESKETIVNNHDNSIQSLEPQVSQEVLSEINSNIEKSTKKQSKDTKGTESKSGRKKPAFKAAEKIQAVEQNQDSINEEKSTTMEKSKILDDGNHGTETRQSSDQNQTKVVVTAEVKKSTNPKKRVPKKSSTEEQENVSKDNPLITNEIKVIEKEIEKIDVMSLNIAGNNNIQDNQKIDNISVETINVTKKRGRKPGASNKQKASSSEDTEEEKKLPALQSTSAQVVLEGIQESNALCALDGTTGIQISPKKKVRKQTTSKTSKAREKKNPDVGAHPEQTIEKPESGLLNSDNLKESTENLNCPKNEDTSCIQKKKVEFEEKGLSQDVPVQSSVATLDGEKMNEIHLDISKIHQEPELDSDSESLVELYEENKNSSYEFSGLTKMGIFDAKKYRAPEASKYTKDQNCKIYLSHESEDVLRGPLPKLYVEKLMNFFSDTIVSNYHPIYQIPVGYFDYIEDESKCFLVYRDAKYITQAFR